jgi:hypothetical protein
MGEEPRGTRDADKLGTSGGGKTRSARTSDRGALPGLLLPHERRAEHFVGERHAAIGHRQ